MNLPLMDSLWWEDVLSRVARYITAPWRYKRERWHLFRNRQLKHSVLSVKAELIINAVETETHQIQPEDAVGGHSVQKRFLNRVWCELPHRDLISEKFRVERVITRLGGGQGGRTLTVWSMGTESNRVKFFSTTARRSGRGSSCVLCISES